MKLTHFANKLFVEFLSVWCLVEIKVSAKKLITSFACGMDEIEGTLYELYKEMKETVLKVAEYENEGKKRTSIVVIVYCSLGILALIGNLIMSLVDMPDTFMTGFLKGSTLSMAIVAMLLAIIYATGTMAKMYAFKKRCRSKK